MYPTQQKQTLETNHLTNKIKNEINLDIPKINQTNLAPNKNNTPKFTNFNPQLNPSFNPQLNPSFNPQFNPSFSSPFNPSFNPSFNSPFNRSFNTQYSNTIKKKRVLTGFNSLGIESKRIQCPFCEENIKTEIHKSTNIKAVLIAIGTFYIGFVLIQTCKNKPISCKDCEHTCPNCGHIVGKYYAM